jgi:cell division protein FtsA
MGATKVSAIDIGTSNVRTLIGITGGPAGWRLLGVGIAPSRGLEKGSVTDTVKVEDSIRQSIKSAEAMAGFRLKSACFSLSEKRLSSVNQNATVSITGRSQTVSPDDISRALKLALDSQLLDGWQWLQTVPRSYTLDGNPVHEPVGMFGYELNMEVHLLRAAAAPLQDLTRCVANIGVKIKDIIPGSWASAEAVLSEVEKHKGILVVDIGAGYTDITIFKNGLPYYTSVLPLGGALVTQDIATCLKVPSEVAEDLKKKYGLEQLLEGENDNVAAGGNGQKVSLNRLNDVIKSRLEELFRLIMLALEVFEIPRTNLIELIPYGIVITGGGANLPGINKLAQETTSLPVRTGRPPKFSDVSNPRLGDPSFATGVGLLIWQMKHRNTPKWWPKPGKIHALTT